MTQNFFARQAITFRNEMRQASGALLGIVQGILADGHLNDREVSFLRDWLRVNDAASAAWPGNVIATQIESALADGVLDDVERAHLVDTLQHLIGGTLDELAESKHVSELPIDWVTEVQFSDRRFCLTGDFCFGTRASCEEAITARGGVMAGGVSKKLDYLVVGGLGSSEWKHGSFGTKIEKAMQLKQAGALLKIVHEDPWASSIMGR